MAKKKAKSVKKKSAARSRQQAKRAGKSSSSVSLKALSSEVWPLERDVLFRPDRIKYVRKLIPVEGCVFCNAEKTGVSFESLCVAQTEHSMVILNKFPYNPGHLMVLPRKHCGDLLKLSEAEYLDLNQLVKKTFAALQQVYSPGGINLGLNHGAVAGAGIPEHLHFHLIPRWSGDLNFFPLIAETKVVVESLDTTFQRLSDYFNR